MKTFFLFLFLIFILPIRLFADKKANDDVIEKTLARINNVPTQWRTFAAKFSLYEREGIGKEWMLQSEYQTRMDKGKKFFFLGFCNRGNNKSPRLTTVEHFVKENIHTTVSKHVWKKNMPFDTKRFRRIGGDVNSEVTEKEVKKMKFKDETFVIIKKNINWLNGKPSEMVYFYEKKDEIWEHIFRDGKIIYPFTKLKIITCQGKQVLLVEPTDPSNKSSILFRFLFDVETGTLLERATYRVIGTNGELKDIPDSRVIYSDYKIINGIFIPSVITTTFANGQGRKLQLITDGMIVNEPMKEIDFVPVIPAGAAVMDKIKGINYVAPSIGNPAAEKQIVEELDAIFEEAKK